MCQYSLQMHQEKRASKFKIMQIDESYNIKKKPGISKKCWDFTGNIH